MKHNKLALCAILGALSFNASAQNNTLRLGAARVDINSQSPNLSSNGPAFLTPQPAGLVVGDASTVVLSYSRRIDQNWDAELVIGVPPEHEVTGSGMLEPFGVLSRVKQGGPTVFLNYKFGDESSALRPFVGLGINHTRFFDAQSSDANNLAAGGPTKIELTHSTGPAMQIGANYRLAPKWIASATIATAIVESDLTATTGSIARTTTIDFRPLALSICIGYQF